MNNIKIILSVLVISFLIPSCRNSPKTAQIQGKEKENILTKVSLRQEWFASASYLGDVTAMNETAEKNGIIIDIVAGADDIDPIKMVISGSNDFGVCGADRIFTANEKGADLVAIGVINYVNPTCFLAKKEKNILTPKDFEHHTIGVFSGNNTELIYRTLVEKQNLDKSKLKEIEAPFDLATFITGAYDIRPAYIFDETVSLDEKDIEYSIIKPQDYGVSFIGTVYFTTREMIENKPKIVQSFVNSVAQGWEIAAKNPQKAIEYLAKYDSQINKDRELLSFQKGLDYFQGQNRKVLWVNRDNWAEMKDYLVSLDKIQASFSNEIMDYTFINNYHVNPLEN